jgi:hypothetical protein
MYARSQAVKGSLVVELQLGMELVSWRPSSKNYLVKAVLASMRYNTMAFYLGPAYCISCGLAINNTRTTPKHDMNHQSSITNSCLLFSQLGRLIAAEYAARPRAS